MIKVLKNFVNLLKELTTDGIDGLKDGVDV
jgi:hypothetical protein